MEELSLGSSVDEISKGSLLYAKKQDQVIGRFVTFLKTKRWPKSWEIKRELTATKANSTVMTMACYLEEVDHTPSWCYLSGFTALSSKNFIREWEI